MAWLEIEGLRTHYEIAGGSSLPALLFSHCLGADLSIWEPQFRALSTEFRIIRYDTLGHGQSAVPRKPYTIEKLGRQALALLDALAIERTSFCGISMGGLIGQWLALQAPDRIQKLILVDTAARIGNREGWNTRIEDVLKDGIIPIIPGALQRWFTSGFHAANPEIVARTKAMLEIVNVEGYTNCCAALRDADFRADIHSIGIPTLVITGQHDPVTPPEDGRFLAENIAGARYIELPAAHLSNVEAASEFNSALLAFLKL
jgi:3-oxoadipate enol-lactonase